MSDNKLSGEFFACKFDSEAGRCTVITGITRETNLAIFRGKMRVGTITPEGVAVCPYRTGIAVVRPPVGHDVDDTLPLRHRIWLGIVSPQYLSRCCRHTL